jgi:hypothetical protein
LYYPVFNFQRAVEGFKPTELNAQSWNRKGTATFQVSPLNLYLIIPLILNGGGERDRTDDLLRAKQVLSQLSYTPENWWA